MLVGGLIHSVEHIFTGLNRPLFCDDSMDGDKDKLIYVSKPSYDYEWVGGPQGGPGDLEAPDNSVFVVVISLNLNHQDKYPDIFGWVDSWTWVHEDPGLPSAPIDWVERYDKKIWSKKK